MTPNPPLNVEITKPICHRGGAVWRARRLQHGCLTKATGALLEVNRAAVCLSVCGRMSGSTEKKQAVREPELLTFADWSVSLQYQMVQFGL